MIEEKGRYLRYELGFSFIYQFINGLLIREGQGTQENPWEYNVHARYIVVLVKNHRTEYILQILN
jgi:hypothetical protein